MNIKSWFSNVKKTAKWLYGKIRTSTRTALDLSLVAAEATLSVGNKIEAWEPEDLVLLEEAKSLVVQAQQMGAGQVVGAERLEAVRLGLVTVAAAVRIFNKEFDLRWDEKYRPWIEALIAGLKARNMAGFAPSE